MEWNGNISEIKTDSTTAVVVNINSLFIENVPFFIVLIL